MKSNLSIQETLLREIARCRACRFCMDVCPTYQASDGVESQSSFGRLQTMKYLFKGLVSFDDPMIFCLYSCLQCKRCEVVCKSKGQNLEICELVQLGRALLSGGLAEGGRDAAL